MQRGKIQTPSLYYKAFSFLSAYFVFSFVLRLKKLHASILRSFAGPFVASFAVSLFILVIQFLSRYQDMIAGKGLSGVILLKLFTYASAHLVILALPLAILVSTLMTMGNLGANYELAAIKSAGVSIHRLITPMLYAVSLLFLFSLWFSFYIVPLGNLKLFSLMWDIQQTKPTFALKAGHFYKGIDGYSLRVSKKSKDGGVLEDIMIYNTSEGRGNVELILADSAEMHIKDNGMTMQMNLFRGCRYEEVNPSTATGKDQIPFSRYYFDSLRYFFDMSGFGLKRSDENAFGTHQKMLNIVQLSESMDSLKLNPDKLKEEFKFTHLKPLVLIDSSLLKKATLKNDSALLSVYDAKIGILSTFPDKMRYDIISRALNTARSIKNYTDYTVTRIEEEKTMHREFKIELHSRFMLPITCLIFLYIGAPLGAIIRKGGVGMPMVVSVCFFIFFWFLMMQGNKLAKEGILDPWAGIWLPVYILGPMAVWITWKASVDSPMFDASSYSMLFNKLRRKNKKDQTE